MNRPLTLSFVVTALGVAACRNDPPARRPAARDSGRAVAAPNPAPTPPPSEPEPVALPTPSRGDAAVPRGPTGPGVFAEQLDGGATVRGNVELGPAAVMSGADRINHDALNTALRALIPRFRECYRGARVADPRASGSVNLTFVIGEDGRVRSVSSMEIPDGSAVDSLPRCTEIALRGATLPRPQGNSTVEAEIRVGYIPL